MSTSHTPGPWHLLLNDETQEFDIVNDNEKMNIAHVHIEEDARLIAAAPNLLEALKQILDINPCCPGVSEIAQEAIAKATTPSA